MLGHRKILASIVLIGAFSAAAAFGQTPTPTPAPVDPTIETTPAMTAPTAIATPAGTGPLLGTDSVTANVTQAQSEIETALNNALNQANGTAVNTSGAGNFGTYNAQYQAFQSTPFLYVIGLPLGAILSSVYFTATLWGLLLVFVAVSIAGHLRNAKEAQMDYYVGLALKLTAAMAILSFPNLIYSGCRTVMDGGLYLVSSLKQSASATPGGVASRLSAVLAQSGTQNIEVQEARNNAIKNGLADRQGIFTRYDTPSTPTIDQAATDYWAAFLNAMSSAQASANTGGASNGSSYPQIPRVQQTGMTGATAPLDDVRLQAVARYAALAYASANQNTSGVNGTQTANGNNSVNFALNWSFSPYNSTQSNFTITPLSTAISGATANITTALANTDTSPQGQQQRTELLRQYEQTVRQATSNWVDSQLIDNFVSTMNQDSRLWGVVADVGDYGKRALLSTEAAIAPSNIIDKITSVLSIVVTACQKVLIPALASVASLALGVIFELSLLGLMCAVPFWFFDGTKKAFTGAIETLIACTIVLPMWQFFQMVLDALFAGISSVVSTGGFIAAVGATATGGIAVVPAFALVISLGLALAYLVSAVLLLFKTPAMVKGFLSGGGWATHLVGAAIKGMAVAAVVGTAGASAAIGGAGVAGSGSLAAGASSTGAGGAASRMSHFGRGVISGMGGGAPQYSSRSHAFGGTFGRAFRGAADQAFHVARHGGDPLAARDSYRKAQEEKDALAAKASGRA